MGGLGLAITREIATAHSGHISISDSPAGGARVSVELPQALGVPDGAPWPRRPCRNPVPPG
jgi:signal transduction histidine kinase